MLLQSWGGGSDSYFEYLIKYPRLTNTKDDLFTDTWATAVDTSIKVLAKVGIHICCFLLKLYPKLVYRHPLSGTTYISLTAMIMGTSVTLALIWLASWLAIGSSVGNPSSR